MADIKFRWEDDPTGEVSDLFVGRYEWPMASLYRSGKRKTYRVTYDARGLGTGHREYLPLDVAKATAEAEIRRFFEAITDNRLEA